MAQYPRAISILCLHWLPTLVDLNERRWIEEEMLCFAVLHHDGERLEAEVWLGDTDENYFNAMQWLVDAYSIDARVAHTVFHGPLGAPAMKRAIENDHVATIRLLLR
ncbi:hypothetical protein AC1031_011588 [Aphanomyces cochlioides]|nr:hypothetical protein AC1031_011588 [Aphanomyces cochlioides]